MYYVIYSYRRLNHYVLYKVYVYNDLYYIKLNVTSQV